MKPVITLQKLWTRAFIRFSTSRNPLIMLRHLSNCITSAEIALSLSTQNGIGADHKLKMIIYIVLKASYSCVSFFC